jgi:hypothetical protein
MAVGIHQRQQRQRSFISLVVPLALVFALVALVAPAAAAGAKYEGSVTGGGPLSFRLAGEKVKRFQASVTVTCISVAPARSDIEAYVVAPSAVAPVNRSGRFSLKLELPKQQLTDESGEIVDTLYSVKASVEGKLHGHSASGTVKVSYNKYWTAYDPVTGYYVLTIASCFSGKTKIPWHAAS